jgi:hypothetical protein
VIEYRYATSTTVQSAEDLDRLKTSVTAVADANGRPLGNEGNHNQLSVSQKLGKNVITASGYMDHMAYAVIGGSGLMTRNDLQSGTSRIIEDPVTATFQIAGQGYASRGISAQYMRALTPALSAWVEYDLGTALTNAGGTPSLADVGSSVSPKLTSAVSAAVRGKIVHTGTSVKAEYRWQPENSLTQVNGYNASAEEAYLSFFLRQRLWCGRFLPQGVDAVVEATNLLEQGYQPVLAPDGHTLFLAQMPRAIQGGLAFNF